jgi:hypothetical protein
MKLKLGCECIRSSGGLFAAAAFVIGLEQKARDFVEKFSEIYAKL